MSKITRSEVFARGERGPEWFQDFLYNLSQTKESSTQDILEAINGKRGETVQGVVDKYKEMVGLDSVAQADDDETEKVATASTKPEISIRQAKEEEPTVVMIIEEEPNLKGDVESICEHSGGHKDTYAIIRFLRDQLGSDLVSFSDKDLIDYIGDIKKEYLDDVDEPRGNAGRVGMDDEPEREDNLADYVAHGTGNLGGM